MPAPTIPRTPIQKFTKAELDEADLCARALWNGISFETGKKVISDAWLLDAFATPFYKIPLSNTYNSVTDLDVKELVKACKLIATFRDTNKQHYLAGLSVISQQIYPIYDNWLHKAGGLSREVYGALAVSTLSDGLAMRNPQSNRPVPHRTVLASRLMFFIAPTMQCFNMNNSIALKYGLQSRPYAYRDEYCSLMYDGLMNNWSLLQTYKLPDCTNELTYETWQKLIESDWWQRRVLDIAVLIKNGLASTIKGLATIYKQHTDELKNKGLIKK